MIDSDIVVSSRIRLARNLAKVPFPNKLTAQAASEHVAVPINKILSDVSYLTVSHIRDMPTIDQQILHERRLISRDLMENALNGSVAINNDESIAIMVNEEDHIREQCILPGLFLLECFEELEKIDDQLIKELDIAFDARLGFLTASPTNLGTGMRASVMLFLPALTITGKINDIILNINKQNITVRGGSGEGSNAEGYTYQISNTVTLGASEFDIIRNVTSAVKNIAELETNARVSLYRERATELTDQALRAWGVLTNCFTITMNEFLQCLAKVKLGVSLGIINLKNKELLNELDVRCRRASLLKDNGRELKDDEVDIFRADYLMRTLSGNRII